MGALSTLLPRICSLVQDISIAATSRVCPQSALPFCSARSECGVSRDPYDVTDGGMCPSSRSHVSTVLFPRLDMKCRPYHVSIDTRNPGTISDGPPTNMPRYLTSPKLALLLLIETYTTLDLSQSARRGILNFLSARIVIRSDFDAQSLNERFDLASASDISAFAKDLTSLPINQPGRNVYDVFLARVWALDGLDALIDFVKQLADGVGAPPLHTPEGEGIPPPKISRASPLGQFIRRSNVEFTRLQFPDAQALWSSFDAFRSSSFSAWATRNPEAAQSLQNSVPERASRRPSSDQPQTSTEDTSLLLSFSIHHLQKLGHRLPPDLRANLAAFMNQGQDPSSQSLQHFLAFFDHWRAGQYTMALESLHRYYDYSIASQGPGGVGKDGTKDGNGGGGPGSSVRVYYQYALLHLSVLHADFECWEASVAAMEECVATGTFGQTTQKPFCCPAASPSAHHHRISPAKHPIYCSLSLRLSD